MLRKEVTLQNEEGLHARPASMLAQKASKFASEIKIIKNNTEYNAKSIMALLSMGAAKGESLMIQASGEDESTAVEALVQLICEIE